MLRLQALTDGKIAAILSDNGSEFAKYFDEACRRFNIIHIFSRVKTPKDNAIDERFNRTIQEEFIEVDEYFEPYLTETNLVKANERLTEWLIFYNFKRPHQSLDYRSPIEYYHYKFFEKQKLSPMYPTLTALVAAEEVAHFVQHKQGRGSTELFLDHDSAKHYEHPTEREAGDIAIRVANKLFPKAGFSRR